MGTAEAAKLAGVCEYTIRIWCGQYLIGRKVAGRWRVSRTALGALLSGIQQTDVLDSNNRR